MSANRITLRGGERMERELRKITQSLQRDVELRVGFLEGATYPETDNLAVAQVAFWNEFGTSRAPSRPFFRDMIERESSDWGKFLENSLRVTNYNWEASLRRLGFLMKQQLVTSIREFDTPPNAPSTIERKGFNNPLIDTGVMQRNTGFEIGNKS